MSSLCQVPVRFHALFLKKSASNSQTTPHTRVPIKTNYIIEVPHHAAELFTTLEVHSKSERILVDPNVGMGREYPSRQRKGDIWDWTDGDMGNTREREHDTLPWDGRAREQKQRTVSVGKIAIGANFRLVSRSRSVPFPC